MQALSLLLLLAAAAFARDAEARREDAFQGVEVWACRPEGEQESDGRCYAPAGTCNPNGPSIRTKPCREGQEMAHETCFCPRDGTSPDGGRALGLGLLYFKRDDGYHVVTANLRAEGLEVHATSPGPAAEHDMKTVSDHARSNHALVALNANYFGGPLNVPCGAARGAGRQYVDAYHEDHNCVISLGWSRYGGAMFETTGHHLDEDFRPEFPDIVTGGGYLLKEGRRSEWNTDKLEAGRACSAVGLNGDRSRLILVATDRTSCTGEGLQEALLAFGASDALLLDGGGSTRLWVGGRYVNTNSGDRRPPVVVYARQTR